MKEIVIKIPTKPEFKRWWEIAKFKLRGGFVCAQCGAKMFFDQVQIETKVHGKTLIFHDMNLKAPIRCPHCIQKEIDQNAEYVFTEQHTCDWCGENHPTVTFYNFHNHEHIHTRFTFGSGWWNGHYICQNCLHIGLEDGIKNMKSSYYGWDAKTKRSLPQNRLGMMQK